MTVRERGGSISTRNPRVTTDESARQNRRMAPEQSSGDPLGEYLEPLTFLAQQFPIPIEDAISYWQTVARWGNGDVGVLRRIVEERLVRYPEPGDSISSAYAPIPQQRAVTALRGLPAGMSRQRP